MPSFSCTVEDSIPSALRLDRYVSECLKILSRSQIKARNLNATLNGKPVKNSRILKPGDYLELSWQEAENKFLFPENIPLDVIYEDKKVIVINKAHGMVVHPGAGNWQGTLANALLYRKLDGSGEGLPELRPYIVHRLDKDTSGVIIAAWDNESLVFLSEQFKERKVVKSYAAIVLGCPIAVKGRIDKRIVRCRRNRKIFTVSETEGRACTTFYKLVRSYGNYSLLLLRPKTGRTHQLRVHLKYLGNPILGDSLYGKNDSVFPGSTLMLHAKRLSLVLPGQKEPTTFRTMFPQRFLEVINVLNK